MCMLICLQVLCVLDRLMRQFCESSAWRGARWNSCRLFVGDGLVACAHEASKLGDSGVCAALARTTSPG